MKTVFFVRHAKSSWDNPSLSDRDRPLNARGLRDAPQMGLKLKQLNANIELIVSSPAKRAFTTATFFAAALGLPLDEIVLEPRLYEAMSEDVISVINGLSDEYKVIAIFGHNPTFTFIANLFTEDYIDNIPTCGVFKVDARINSWKEFGENSGRLTAFYYPKQSLL
ncbi:MAG: histidine phosphatase family protein [Haliscomenobacter sp.]|uniref:SixA phosphatase family protein n=1 Tax=Haliscomenobacter sp. TaxID=2717303 RepID=UPI0029B6FC01|nr:histidine phosphatase family protein [Haliscomenobacter sp.]MDX2067540.1 histidine phosphatase family protein [Haliscomenobacter sp.]